MPYSLIKYREPQEVVPTFLYTGDGSIEPSFTVCSPAPNALEKQFVHIGIAAPDAIGNFEVIPSKDALTAYFAENIFSFTKTLPDGTQKPFDPIAEASAIWAKLEALNA